jgi:signal transduction histidine kinase
MVARLALTKIQQYQNILQELEERERMLGVLLDRSSEDRRDERRRIAGDLHDDVLQALIEIRMLASAIFTQPMGRDRDDEVQIVTSIERATDSLRGVIQDLQKSPIGTSGLGPALLGLVRDARLDWRLPVTARSPSSVEASPDVQVVCYQVAREALINVSRHAKATSVELELEQDRDRLLLKIRDNGDA